MSIGGGVESAEIEIRISHIFNNKLTPAHFTSLHFTSIQFKLD